MAVPDQVLARKGEEKDKQKRNQNVSPEIGPLKRRKAVENLEVMFIDEHVIDLFAVGTK